MTDHAAPLRPLLMAIASNGDMPRSARTHAAMAEAAQDIEAVLARTAQTIIALEDAVTTAEAHAKVLREALSALMVDTGAPTLIVGRHTIGTNETRRVLITDEAAIPPMFMRERAPAPDTQAIRAALEKGGSVPGATLTNGTPTLFIRSRKA